MPRFGDLSPSFDRESSGLRKPLPPIKSISQAYVAQSNVMSKQAQHTRHKSLKTPIIEQERSISSDEVKFQAKSKITDNMAAPVSFTSKQESDSQLLKQTSPLIKKAYGEDNGRPLMIKERSEPSISESQTPVVSIDDY